VDASGALTWDGTDVEGNPGAPVPNSCSIPGDAIAEGLIQPASGK
jgi:hypothetical protein